MKKIILSGAAVLAMSSLAVAGGDILPVAEPIIVADEAVVTESIGLYVGLAYGLMGDEYTRTPNIQDPRSFDETYGAVMGQAGLKINQYIAVEGRYWWAASDITVNNWIHNYDLEGANAWGIYAKPMLPVNDSFDVYALLGYGGIDHNSVKLNDGDGFSWGFGATYGVSENVGLFVDYVSIYNGDRSFTDDYGHVSKDIDVDSINFGVTYNF